MLKAVILYKYQYVSLTGDDTFAHSQQYKCFVIFFLLQWNGDDLLI